jgi:hypothetical protein
MQRLLTLSNLSVIDENAEDVCQAQQNLQHLAIENAKWQ